MVSPRFRARTFRRTKVTTPGGRRVQHHTPRPHNRAQCGQCKEPLQAVFTARRSLLRRLSKSERRPSRPYGGVLCSRCSRATIKAKARVRQ